MPSGDGRPWAARTGWANLRARAAAGRRAWGTPMGLLIALLALIASLGMLDLAAVRLGAESRDGFAPR